MQNNLRNYMTKNRFLKYVQKMDTSTESDLEFLVLLKRNSYQNITFFRKNPQKVIEKITFF